MCFLTEITQDRYNREGLKEKIRNINAEADKYFRVVVELN